MSVNYNDWVASLSTATIAGTETVAVVQATVAKKAALSAVAAYAVDTLVAAAAVDPVAAGDDFLLFRSGTEKLADVDKLASYIVASGWSVATEANPAVTNDMILVNRGGTIYEIDVETLSDYVFTLGPDAASAVSSVSGDEFFFYRGADPMVVDVDDVAAYALASIWSSDTVTSALSTDMVLLGRSSTCKQITSANLAASLQASVLDISGLGAATLAGTDQILVIQTATAKKTTLTALETKVYADLVTHVSALSAVTVSADADVFHVIQGGTEKKVTPVELATYFTAACKDAVLDAAWDAAVVTPALTGDVLILQRSDVLQTMTVDTIGAFAIAAFGASAAVSPVAAADKFTLFRSNVAKTADVADVASYVLTTAWSSDVVTTLISSDDILIGRSAASKMITLANLETQIVADKKATILDVSGLSAATLGATDEFLVNQSGVAKKAALSAIETKLDADFAVYAAALADATTLVGADKFYVLNAGTPKHATATEIATFTTASILASAAVTPAAAGQKFLVNVSDVAKTLDIDLLATYVNTSAQATVLNLSGLDTATLAGTDLLAVCQTTTGRKATVTALTAYVHDDISVYLTSLNAVTALADADLLYCTQSGTEKKLAVSTLVDYAVASARTLPWTTIAGSKYTATPASTSTLTMSDTSDLAIGLPVKYTYNSVTYYGIVTAISANALLTIAGAPFNTGLALSNLSVGIPEQIEQVDFFIESPYDDTAQDILATLESRYFKWQKAKAYLVSFSATHDVADTGATQPYVNVKVNTALVSTNSSNHGILLSATPGTWTDNSAVAVSTTNYDINRGEAVEINCAVVGTNGDAECLTVSCVFVYE